MISPQELKRQYQEKKIKLKEYLRRIYNLALFYKRRADKDVTGAFSRVFFEDIIKIEHAQITRSPNLLVTLMILDVDFFKQYNDRYGHRAGDELLQNLVSLLKKRLRKGDVVCRYGGEEFAVILSGTDSKGAAGLSHHLRGEIKKKLKVTISIGICQDSKEISIEKLIKNADSALYQAKEAGRNREVIFND